MKHNLKKLISKTKWYYVNPDITEENFPVPKTIETKNPRVIRMDKRFSLEEALEKIKSEGCRPANIYELLYLKENHPEYWKDGRWTGILALGSVWKDSDGRHGVPGLTQHSDGDWGFYLGGFEFDWHGGHCLLCFCDKEPSDTLSIKESLEPLDTSLENAIKVVKSHGYKIYKEY